MLGLKGRGGEAPTFIKTQHICPWPGVGREEKGAEHVVRPVLPCQKHSKLDKQYKISEECGGGGGGPRQTRTSIFVSVVMFYIHQKREIFLCLVTISFLKNQEF